MRIIMCTTVRSWLNKGIYRELLCLTTPKRIPNRSEKNYIRLIRVIMFDGKIYSVLDHTRCFNERILQKAVQIDD